MEPLASVPARHPPERAALIHGEARWTWGELDARSRLWANTLAARGVTGDDLVAYTLPNGPDFFALTFGIYRAGATPAPLSPKLPAIEREAILKLGADHIWEVYGATEGLVRCWIGGAEWLERPGSVGRPIGGANIRILDEDGRDVPTGLTGEIFAMPPGGPASTYRYIGAERRATADGWESVGDCGSLDQDGYLFLADRKCDMIISGGINIWPAEVEAALLRHPDIRSCAVWGEPDDDLGQRVHAAIETDAPIALVDMRAFLADHLARDKWPRTITVGPDPVRDDAGKFRKTYDASA